MKKVILATNIDGLLIKHGAFIEPHKAWFDKAISITGNKSLEQWKNREDYFKGVNIAMSQIMPNATEEQRTEQAREWYQEAVIEYIKKHQKVVNKDLAEFLRKLKLKFTLALITTNTKEHINQILEAAGLDNLYDIVFASSSKEKPDKTGLFEGFVKKYNSPKFFLAARSKESFEQCNKLKIISIYFAFEELDEEIKKIAKVTVRNKEELKALLT